MVLEVWPWDTHMLIVHEETRRPVRTIVLDMAVDGRIVRRGVGARWS